MTLPGMKALQKRLQKFEAQRAEWVEKVTKNGNKGKVIQESHVMVAKLRALGFQPLLLIGHYDHKKRVWHTEPVVPEVLEETQAKILKQITLLHQDILQDSSTVQPAVHASEQHDKCLSAIHEPQRSQNKSDSHGDSNDEDWSGDVDEEDPQRDSDEGQNDTSQHDQQSDSEQSSQTPLSENEVNGTNGLNGCRNAVERTNNNEEKDPPSTGEEYGLSTTVQGSLHKMAFNPGKTVNGMPKLKCNECDKIFYYAGNLNKHEKTHTKVVSPAEMEGVSPDKKDNDKLRCSECGQVFSCLSVLTKHKKNHTKDNCKKKAPRKYACSICDKVLKKSQIEDHERLHTGERPFMCSCCGKTFRMKVILELHMRTHTGQRPYECSVCGKRFSQHSNMASHKRLHTGEKPYLCSFCGKAFTTSGACLHHTRTHTGERPYKCEFCEKTFTMSCHLTAHRRRHTNERPYPCTVCSKRFAGVSELKNHMRIHTGEKPYECLVCGKKFARADNMKTHQRVHR